jgi:hypothetical protein
MRRPSKRGPPPPRLSLARSAQQWDRVVSLAEYEIAEALAPNRWVQLEAASDRSAVLIHAGAPVQLWLWGCGRWHFVPGPLGPDARLPGDHDGLRIALRAEGPAQIGGRLLRQEGGDAVDWPDLEPPDRQPRCTHRATNGINGAECDVGFAAKRNLCCEIHYVVQPGSVWETPAGQAALGAELRRCQAWWARYCIYLAFRPVTLPAPDRARLARDCLIWNQTYPRDNNDATTAFHSLTYWLYGECRRAARARRVIMFFDRCLSWRSGTRGKQGHNNNDLVGVGRATPGSATIIGRDAIIIHGVEVRSQHVVTHELIHLLGRPARDPFQQSQTTWNHTSQCQESMSTAPARGLAPFVFGDDRLLDVAEYPEVAQAGHLKRC